MGDDLMKAERCYLLLMAPPNPETLLCVEGLTDGVPRLKFASSREGLNSAREILGNPQGLRFHWEPFALPETFTLAPFDRNSGEWQMMLHLCRPRETGILSLRLYLKRFCRDQSGALWHYMMAFTDQAPAIKFVTDEGLQPLPGLRLANCLAPARLTTYIHATRPGLDFDLRLRSGDAWAAYVQRDGKDVTAEVSVSDADGKTLLQHSGTLRDLSVRCDGVACQIVPPRSLSVAEGQQLTVRGSINTGPWSGLVTLNDAIRI